MLYTHVNNRHGQQRDRSTAPKDLLQGMRHQDLMVGHQESSSLGNRESICFRLLSPLPFLVTMMRLHVCIDRVKAKNLVYLMTPNDNSYANIDLIPNQTASWDCV